MKNMKGQLSYIIKPISLVMIVVLLIILYQSITFVIGKEKSAQDNLDLATSATSVLLILANSKDCIAYETAQAQGIYANIVDVRKLEEFSEKYSNTEPECARSFEFGWRVKIIELKEDDSEGDVWEFGADQFSTSNAFRNSFRYKMPIAIKYSEKDVRPGRIEVQLVDGELERISGILDWTCQMGKLGRMQKSSAEIYTTYPIIYDSTDGKLCLKTKIPICRKMMCNMEFENMEAPGTYILSMNFENDNLVVRT